MRNENEFGPLSPLTFMEEFARMMSGQNELPSYVQAMRIQNPVDAKETETTYEVSANLPGFKKENVDLSVVDGVLTIEANKTVSNDEETGTYLVKERSSNSVKRTFRLPENVDETKISAKMEDGVLTVVLPKVVSEPKSVNKINIM